MTHPSDDPAQATSTPLPNPVVRGRSENYERAWSPEAVHVLAKPTGAICNLACSYCFFLDKEELYEGDRFRMSDDLAETYIRSLIEAHRTPQVTVAWQGGEPTLMGLDFYRRVIDLENRYARPGMTFLNTLQTNGTLLTDEWCEFFAERDFLIGISIDGPREIHDAYRVNKRGEGTFDKVMRGLRLLQKHGVEYNVLTTVNRLNGDHPIEVYRFLRDEARTDWMQFIPVVERVDAQGNPADLRGNVASERSVGSEQFGRFLTAVFDEWVRHDVGDVFVQTIEAAARNWAGMGQSGMCVFNETCGSGLALEHNGDLYSCDHFVDPEFLVGNIAQTPLRDLVAGRQQHDFGRDKLTSLPRYCLDCDVRFACHGECPKNRFLTTPDGDPGLNYLCAGFKDFFHHIDRPMRIMIDLMRRGRPASDVMEILVAADRPFQSKLRAAGRNDACPCGSGLKMKRCHGAAPTPTPLPDQPGAPRPPVTERGRRAAEANAAMRQT
ncbi:MAG: anaerobic sulfatase maturase [Acidimicrobiia bacterium]|nr:anaerobic sulfatase maturase [Acidimicrobiia bacterium]MDH4306693.1 anaerobic sulfatase maturase [Acidimicrobiia bacterium]MDH5292560.1 anaerobic sulfatase maturase [Acidimicrobiia bacterium]MDH5521197.1 anaerobic sulfatase maturase [Acidimicrobiia bacterium]